MEVSEAWTFLCTFFLSISRCKAFLVIRNFVRMCAFVGLFASVVRAICTAEAFIAICGRLRCKQRHKQKLKENSTRWNVQETENYTSLSVLFSLSLSLSLSFFIFFSFSFYCSVYYSCSCSISSPFSFRFSSLFFSLALLSVSLASLLPFFHLHLFIFP